MIFDSRGWLRIKVPIQIGVETPLLGILAHSWWATAARNAKKQLEKDGSLFWTRHVHPSVAPVMERSALIGG